MLKKIFCAVFALLILFSFSSCDTNSFFSAMTGKQTDSDDGLPENVSRESDIEEEQSAIYCQIEGMPELLVTVLDCYYTDNLDNTGLKKDSFFSNGSNFSKINDNGTLTDENLTFVILNIKIKKLTEGDSWYQEIEDHEIERLPDFRLANYDYSECYGDDVCLGFELTKTEDITRDYENSSHFSYYSLPCNETANMILGFMVEKTDIEKISRLKVNGDIVIIDDGKTATVSNTGIKLSLKER